MVFERIAPVKQQIDVTHTHEIVDHDAEALKHLRALKALGVARDKLAEVFGGFGLDRLEARVALEDKSQAIEADYKVIESRDR